MKATDIYNFIYDWVDLVVNTIGGRSIPIIESHDNAPAEAGVFITIKYAPMRTKEGRPSIESDVEVEDGAPAEDPGTRSQYQDQLLLVELWETDAYGDCLNELSNSGELDAVLTYFCENGFVYVRDEGVKVVPRLQDDNKWKRESMLEVVMRIANVTEETLQWIESVNYTGKLPAQGRTGEHNITNT